MNRVCLFAFAAALLLSSPAAFCGVGDWYVIKLKDGSVIEGKVTNEDLLKIEVEYQKRGITWPRKIYRSDTSDITVLSPAQAAEKMNAISPKTEVSRPQAAPTTIAVAPSAAVQAAPTSVQPPEARLLQKGRELIAQNKYPEAAAVLEQAVSSSPLSNAQTEPKEALHEAYSHWLQTIRLSQKHATNNLAVAKLEADLAQKNVESAFTALENRRRQENQVGVISTPARVSSTDGSSTYNNQQTTRVFRGSGDPSAQGVVNSLEIKLLTAQQDFKKRMDVLSGIQKQLSWLDQQIISIKARYLQFFGAQIPDFKIDQVTYGANDVTAFVRKMASNKGVVIRASPEAFGLSEESVKDGIMTISYTDGEESKNVALEAGWTIALPSLQLTPPPAKPWPMWVWGVGGVLALFVVSLCTRKSE